MRRCGACGNPSRKTVRAVIIKSDKPPRMGLVCRVCASCGTLVVPAVLQMLPAKPKRIPRAKAVGMMRQHIDAYIPPAGEDEDGSPLDADNDPDA